MAVTSYMKDGKTYWKVYVNVRNKKDSSLREQKLVQGVETEKAALTEEKRLLRELTEKISVQASQGLTWEAVIDRWELAMREDKDLYGYQLTTIMDYVSRLKNWTPTWLKRPASEINRGDARGILREIELAGKTRKFQKTVKETVNVIFDWGIQERLIREVHESPMRGMELTAKKEEKVPDILTLEEIRKLLFEAKRLESRWYPIWVLALLTGMRNGELFALEWSDVDFENRKITVSKSYNTRFKIVKSTKNGAWRTVPMSDDLYEFLVELKGQTGNLKNVLPRIGKWAAGWQAQELRKFCVGIGIRSIRFHALRACFATQLLAHDIAPARVMKICGWEQLDTMQRYIRMAGIDERGATQVLKVLPSDEALIGEVVSLFDFKKVQQAKS